MIDPHDPEDAAAAAAMAADPAVQAALRTLVEKTFEYRYYLNFKWLGRPIVQYPQDIVAVQEIVWKTRPDVIIETGVAHGGSLVLYASLLELLGRGKVVGVEVELRQHNREALAAHPMMKRIEIVEGSSVAPRTVERVRAIASGFERPMVVLDSFHTHDHVLEELRLYSPLVRAGGALVVFGTSVAYVAPEINLNRPWTVDRNPQTALDEFLRENDRFRVDATISDKLLLTDAPGGYLTCLRDLESV